MIYEPGLYREVTGKFPGLGIHWESSSGLLVGLYQDSSLELPSTPQQGIWWVLQGITISESLLCAKYVKNDYISHCNIF